MKLSDFDYDLPSEYIAQTPVEPRDSSRLLVYERDSPAAQHKIFNQLPDLLRPDDVLVLNDTKVIPARLTTTTGHEVFLVRALREPQGDKVVWECLVRGGKHFAVGAEFAIAADFKGRVLEILDSGERVIEFTTLDFTKALEQYGATPLPPYIHSVTNSHPPAPSKGGGVIERYQTIYADQAGSVAAPTAGLHFTDGLFKKLKAKGIQIEKTTLHVGLGTFLPVKTEQIEDHPMHTEFFTLDSQVAERLNTAKAAGRRIIAVGSTSCRVLESCTDSNKKLKAKTGETDIFIYPGYEFRFISGMLTNFHLPRSTLIMLVAAFIGREKTLELYELAKKEQYRFYSFGDAMLLL